MVWGEEFRGAMCGPTVPAEEARFNSVREDQPKTQVPNPTWGTGVPLVLSVDNMNAKVSGRESLNGATEP